MAAKVLPEPMLLDACQGAAFFGLSERGFHELRNSPNFPPARQLGQRSVRWLRAELIAFAEALPVEDPEKGRGHALRMVHARVEKAQGRPLLPGPFQHDTQPRRGEAT